MRPKSGRSSPLSSPPNCSTDRSRFCVPSSGRTSVRAKPTSTCWSSTPTAVRAPPKYGSMISKSRDKYMSEASRAANTNAGQHPPRILPARSAPAVLNLRPSLQGSVLTVDGRPQLVRAIDCNGEPFAWLKSLGFNSIRLPAPATAEQLREADECGIWLIAPPPTNQLPVEYGESLRQILAWDLGSQLGADQVEPTRRRALQLRSVPESARRAIICLPREETWQYSRIADLVVFEPPGPNGSLPLGNYGAVVSTAFTPHAHGLPLLGLDSHASIAQRCRADDSHGSLELRTVELGTRTDPVASLSRHRLGSARTAVPIPFASGWDRSADRPACQDTPTHQSGVGDCRTLGRNGRTRKGTGNGRSDRPRVCTENRSLPSTAGHCAESPISSTWPAPSTNIRSLLKFLKSRTRTRCIRSARTGFAASLQHAVRASVLRWRNRG